MKQEHTSNNYSTRKSALPDKSVNTGETEGTPRALRRVHYAEAMYASLAPRRSRTQGRNRVLPEPAWPSTMHRLLPGSYGYRNRILEGKIQLGFGGNFYLLAFGRDLDSGAGACPNRGTDGRSLTVTQDATN